MAATNVQIMAKPAKGGSFLTEERQPQDVFTPEDLSSEHPGRLPRPPMNSR